MDPYIKQLRDVRNTEVPSVGGKNASLGEMIATGQRDFPGEDPVAWHGGSVLVYKVDRSAALRA